MKRIKEERDFMHALATPLGTAMFLTDALMDRACEGEASGADLARQIEGIIQALQRIRHLLQERREILAKKSQQ